MILAIDIGNTNIVTGCIKDEKILFRERLSTNHTATKLEYSAIFKTAFEMYGINSGEIDGAIISSVVPSVTGVVKDSIETLCDTQVMVVGPGIKTGISIVIDNPAQLGSDLVVDAVAGVSEYGVPQIIIDMGTATTVSVVNKDSEFTGGVILPGVGTALNALIKNTAQLPQIKLGTPPQSIIGTNTADSIESGMLYGTAAAIDGICDRIFSELGYKSEIVATGGNSGKIIPLCRNKIILDKQLIMKGLNIIYQNNKEKTNA